MNDDMSELMNKLNDMLGSDSSNDLKNLLNNFTSNNSDSKSSSDNSNTSNYNNNNNEDSSNFNIDFDTIMKIKTMMEALNSKKDDPRAKLLMSLKPYLKDTRKSKLDQYVQLLNMSSVFELFKNSGGDINAGPKE